MKTNFKGTPGPWEKHTRTNKRDVSRIVAVIPKYYGERRVETELVTGYIHEDDCNMETCCKVEEHSNARLIAESPVMLEALNDLWVRSTNLFKELTVEEIEDDDSLKALSDSIDNAKAIINRIVLTK